MNTRPPKHRIVQVITAMENGGAQHHVLRLCADLVRRGQYNVTLLCGPEGALQTELMKLRAHGVRVLPIPALKRSINPLHDLKAGLQLAAAIQRQRDVRSKLLVHTHSSKAGILGRLAAASIGADVVVHTFHGFGFHAGRGPLQRNFLRQTERLPSLVTDWSICVCEADLRLGVEQGFLAEDRASVIFAGADLKCFSPTESNDMHMQQEFAALGIPPDSPVIASIACLKAQKGPFDFLHACTTILNVNPQAHVLWVGDGMLRPAIDTHIEANPTLRDRVHLLGWRTQSDIAQVLKRAEIFLLLSHWEGLPLALLEARAAGLPSVATRVCGIPEAITHGEHGFLVERGDSDAAAAYVLKLLKDRDVHTALSQNSRLNLNQFDRAHVEPAHHQLYQQLLS